MATALLLDQPDLIVPARARRMRFGPADAPRIAILNARGARFSGGGDEPDLSLKWVPEGEARYRSEGRHFALSGATQLLLNRGQPYTLDMTQPSESFVVFFDRKLADAAWAAHTGAADAFPEVPSIASLPPVTLHAALTGLRSAARQVEPSGAALAEGALALLSDVAALAFEQRAMLTRLPSLRHTTRAELLRRIARAEAYLLQTQQDATLDGAAHAAALSPFHLIRVFRAVHGVTPLAWAGGKRLDTARDGLLLTGDAIADIARRAGYESRTAFDRAFARRFHQTPGAVRSARG
jgi:AraC family transcriptional regulator